MRGVHRNLGRVHVQHGALQGIQARRYVDAIRAAIIEGGLVFGVKLLGLLR